MAEIISEFDNREGELHTMMEIIVSEGALNGLTNYDELMAFAREQIGPYESLVVTEEQLGAAKDVVARMRKVAKAASDLRIRTEREHAAQIALAVQQLKEVASVFTDAAGKIDSQVKVITNDRKQKKREELRQYFLSVVGNAGKYISFEDIEDEKWLNVSVSIETAKEQIDEAVASFKEAVEAVESMDCDPAIKASVQAEFKRTKSLAAAIKLRQTLEQMAAEQKRRREEEERRKAEQAAQQKAQEPVSVSAESHTNNVTAGPAEPIVEDVYEIEFVVTATRSQFAALRNWLNTNAIAYRRA